jgi:hypothetical protein
MPDWGGDVRDGGVIIGRAEAEIERFEEVKFVVRPLLGQPPLPTRRGHFVFSL